MRNLILVSVFLFGSCITVSRSLAQSIEVLNRRICVDVSENALKPTMKCPIILAPDDLPCPTGSCYANEPIGASGCKYYDPSDSKEKTRSVYKVSKGEGEVATPVDVGFGEMGRIPIADETKRIICNETRNCMCDEIAPMVFECVARPPVQNVLETWLITSNPCFVGPSPW